MNKGNKENLPLKRGNWALNLMRRKEERNLYFLGTYYKPETLNAYAHYP